MRVRVLTYNIHRAIGVDRRFRPERVAAIIDEHSADVVLLQEVDDGVPRSRSLDLGRTLAKELAYPYVAIGHNVRLRRGRYGNATLSRYPIRHGRNIDLSIGRFRRRGCQYTELTVVGPRGGHRRLEVFNLHLGLSARERTAQVERLLGARELLYLDPRVPCVIGGDFNDWRSLLAPTLTDGNGFREATRRNGRGRPLVTYPSFFPRGPLDRLFCRGRIRVIATERSRHPLVRVASDHAPVVADFELV